MFYIAWFQRVVKILQIGLTVKLGLWASPVVLMTLHSITPLIGRPVAATACSANCMAFFLDGPSEMHSCSTSDPSRPLQ